MITPEITISLLPMAKPTARRATERENAPTRSHHRRVNTYASARYVSSAHTRTKPASWAGTGGENGTLSVRASVPAETNSWPGRGPTGWSSRRVGIYHPSKGYLRAVRRASCPMRPEQPSYCIGEKGAGRSILFSIVTGGAAIRGGQLSLVPACFLTCSRSSMLP